MLELKSLRDSLWSGGIVAFVMHGVGIAAFAFGITYPRMTSSSNFCVEIMFDGKSDMNSQNISAKQTCKMVPKKIAAKSLDGAMPLKSTSKKADIESEHANQFSTKTETSFLSGVKDAAPIFNPAPIYPIKARKKKIQGVVMIRLFLSETGAVNEATAVPPLTDPILEEAALKAVYQWRFNPGARTLEVPIEFRLANLS